MPSSGPRVSPARPAGVRVFGVRAGSGIHDDVGVQRGRGAGGVVGSDAVEVGVEEVDGAWSAPVGEGGAELVDATPRRRSMPAHAGDLRLLLGDAVDAAAVGEDGRGRRR